MRLKPKKSLGQNFLIDQNIRKKIIAACDLRVCDTVLEIGSGQGAITGLIAEKVQWVYAVELDKQLCAGLKQAFAAAKNVVVIHADILKFDLHQHFSLLERKVRVIGNIPYYITTPILEHLLEHRDMVGDIFLTVQKEFGQRMAARAGSDSYGAFSCFVQYYTEPKILFDIKKNSFCPAPKVDSCFLRLAVRQKPAVAVKDERMLFKIIRSAFQQRRKTLKNSLQKVVPQAALDAFFLAYKIDHKIRPEQLSLHDFANLTNMLWLA